MASTCAQPDGVVLGAVVDLVAGRVGLADAEVIVVRGVDHHLVLELRIAARQQARDVRRAHARDLVVELDRGRAVPSGTGLKLRLFAAATSLSRSWPPAFTRRRAAVLGGPALELDARLALGGQLELLAAPGGLHHLPRIAGRRRGVHDDHAGRAMARGAFVLVGPAAVVQARLAREQLRIPVRIVVEHHQDLALDVHALEVVPLVLGRLDAVADEHQLGVLDFVTAVGWPPLRALIGRLPDVIVVGTGGIAFDRVLLSPALLTVRLNTASAVGERQILPMQTKSTLMSRFSVSP